MMALQLLSSYTIQEESWPDVKLDLERLGRDSFNETGIGEDKFAYSLDVNAFDVMWEAGLFHTTTLRHKGEVIGYISSVIMERHLQYECCCAQHLIVYIKPEHRSAALALSLMRENEKHLEDLGVKRIYGGTCLNKDISALFKRMKWKATEVAYTKWIGGI